MRREFLRSAVLAGVPEWLEEDLGRSLARMRRVWAVERYGRFRGRTGLGVTATVATRPDQRERAKGFYTTGMGRCALLTYMSFKLAEVVASLGEGMLVAGGTKLLDAKIVIGRRFLTRPIVLALGHLAEMLGREGLIVVDPNRPSLVVVKVRNLWTVQFGGVPRNTPETWFTILALMKVVLIDPEIMAGDASVRDVLAFWQGVDDDVRLAHGIRASGKDGRWAGEVVEPVAGDLPRFVVPRRENVDLVVRMLQEKGPRPWGFKRPVVGRGEPVPQGWKETAIPGLYTHGVNVMTHFGPGTREKIAIPEYLAEWGKRVRGKWGIKVVQLQNTDSVFVYGTSRGRMREVLREFPCFGLRRDLDVKPVWKKPVRHRRKQPFLPRGAKILAGKVEG